MSPFFIANMLPDTASGQIAIETGARGRNPAAAATACSTGTNCIGEAAEAIKRGDVIVAIAGSVETPIRDMAYYGFSNMRGMGTPLPGEGLDTISRPYDVTRDGFVLGEGGAALILEDLEVATARGAMIYAEVVGYGSAADALDFIEPIERGDGVRRAMHPCFSLGTRCLPTRWTSCNPHGTSTPVGDLREAQAISDVFGAHTPDILISATKSMTGHLMGGCGSFEGLAKMLSLYRQVIPATTNTRVIDPEIAATGLNVLMGASRETQVRYALSCNVGLGGHNAAVIFKRYDGAWVTAFPPRHGPPLWRSPSPSSRRSCRPRRPRRSRPPPPCPSSSSTASTGRPPTSRRWRRGSVRRSTPSSSRSSPAMTTS